MTTSPKLLGQIHSNFTEMLPRWLSTKRIKIIRHQWKRWPPELKIEKILKWQLLLYHWASSNQTWQACSSVSYYQIAKIVPHQWTRWPSELKIEKSLNDSSSYIIGPVWIKLDRHVAYVSHYKITKIVPYQRTRWPQELKIEKKNL